MPGPGETAAGRPVCRPLRNRLAGRVASGIRKPVFGHVDHQKVDTRPMDTRRWLRDCKRVIPRSRAAERWIAWGGRGTRPHPGVLGTGPTRDPPCPLGIRRAFRVGPGSPLPRAEADGRSGAGVGSRGRIAPVSGPPVRFGVPGASSTCTDAAEPIPAARAGRTDAYAVRATPVTSAQVWKTWVRAARYRAAERRWRRRWKRVSIPSWAERKRRAWPGDLQRFIRRSRRRVG